MLNDHYTYIEKKTACLCFCLAYIILKNTHKNHIYILFTSIQKATLIKVVCKIKYTS